MRPSSRPRYGRGCSGSAWASTTATSTTCCRRGDGSPCARSGESCSRRFPASRSSFCSYTSTSCTARSAPSSSSSSAAPGSAARTQKRAAQASGNVAAGRKLGARPTTIRDTHSSLLCPCFSGSPCLRESLSTSSWRSGTNANSRAS